MRVGKNISFIIALLAMPGVIRLLRTEWTYNHRHVFRRLGPLAPMETVLDTMRRIREVSAKILQKKIADTAAVTPSDSTLPNKKDVMSLLVQARTREPTDSGFTLTDDMMIEQVVSCCASSLEHGKL